MQSAIQYVPNGAFSIRIEASNTDSMHISGVGKGACEYSV